MKKKMALCLCVTLLAVAAIGGTMAYFTDTDEATNTFTAEGVKIELIEQQVNEEGTALEDFSPNQVLMPIVGSAKGDKDDFGQPVAANYIDKMVTIENTCNSDVWVRAYFAIPSALDDGFENFNADMNILHFDFGNSNKGKDTTYNVQWLWGSEAVDEHKGYLETTIDQVPYNVYYADYYKILSPEETTEQFISGVYLDKNVDMNEDGKYTITHDGQVYETGFDGTIVKCPVYAVAVQAAGFDNAADAIKEAFGEEFNPWATK
jgi:predicted ribosomally synthesized peptide with SipW-like signal peptide